MNLKKGIFLPSDERIGLLSPLLLVPLIVWEMFLPPLPAHLRYGFILLVDFCFAAAGHTGLTWGFLSSTPEGRLWLRDKGRAGILTHLAIVAIVIFSVTLAIFLVPQEPFASQALKSFLFLDWVLVYHHSIVQTQGLSFAYDFKLNPDPKLGSRINSIHDKQKLGFHALILLSCWPALQYIFEFPVMESPWQKWTGAMLAFLAVAWIVYFSMKLSSERRARFIFLSRLMLFPLGFFSFFAAVGYRALHAVEYILLYRKMVRHSRRNLTRLARFATPLSVFYFVCASLLTLFTLRPGEGIGAWFLESGPLPVWFKILAALSITRLYMHYYLDRLLFRMRDPVSANRIGRLLNN